MASSGQGGGASLGTVDVEIRARLDGLERDLRLAQQRINQFDQSFRSGGTARGLGEVEKAANEAGRAIKLLGLEMMALAGVVGVVPGSVSALAGLLGRIGIGGLAAGAGLAAAAAGAIKSVQEFTKAETIMLTTEAVIKATGGAAGKSAEEIADLSRQIGYMTLASDEAVQQAANLLLTFKNINGENFDRALRSAQDLAAVGFGSINTAAIQVAKALEDPTRGLTALRRAGVSFTESQKVVIKEMVETGRKAEAMGIILKQIEGQVGGAGVAAASGMAGAWDKLAEATGNWLERAGEAVIAGTSLNTIVKGIADRLNNSLTAVERGATALGRYEAAQGRLKIIQQDQAKDSVVTQVLFSGQRERELAKATEDVAKARDALVASQIDEALAQTSREMKVAAEAADNLKGKVDALAFTSQKEIELLHLSNEEREIDQKLRKMELGSLINVPQGEKERAAFEAALKSIRQLTEARRELTKSGTTIDLLGSAATDLQRLEASFEALNRKIRENREVWDSLSPTQQQSARDLVVINAEIERVSKRLTALGPLASVLEQFNQKMNQIKASGAIVSEEELRRIERFTRMTLDGTLAMRASADALRLEQATLGMSTAAAAAYRAEQEQINKAKREGTFVSDATRESWRKEAAGIGEATQALEKARIAREIGFQAKTVFLSEQDVRIAQQLRDLYGDDIPRALASSEAAALRFLDNLRLAKNITADFVMGFASDLRQALAQGEKFWDAFQAAGSRAIGRLADRLIDMGLRQATDALFAAGAKSLGISIPGLAGLGTRGATPATPMYVSVVGGLPLAPTGTAAATAIPGMPGATVSTTGAVSVPAVTTAGLPSVSSPSISPALPTLGGTGGSMIPGGGSFLPPGSVTGPAIPGFPSGPLLAPSGGGLTPEQLLRSPLATGAGGGLLRNPNIINPGEGFPSSGFFGPREPFLSDAPSSGLLPPPGSSAGIPAPDTVNFSGGQPNFDFTNVPKVDFAGTFDQFNAGTLKTGAGAFGDVKFGQPWTGAGGQLTPDQMLRTPLASQGAFSQPPSIAGMPTTPMVGAEASGFGGVGTGVQGGGVFGGGGMGGGLTGLGGLGSSLGRGSSLGGDDFDAGEVELSSANISGFGGGGGGEDLSSQIGELKDAFKESTDSVANFTDEITTGTDSFSTQMTTAVGSAAKFGTGLDVGGTKLTGFADGAVQQSTSAMATTATQTTTMGTAAVTTSTQVQQLGTSAQTASSQMSFGGGGGGFGSIFGMFGGFKEGGLVRGFGGPREDRTLIAASPGEYMVKESSTRKYRPLIDLINDDKLEGLMFDLNRRGHVPIMLPHMRDGGPMPEEGVSRSRSRQYVPALARGDGDSPAGGRGTDRGPLGSDSGRETNQFNTKIINAIDGTSFLNEALASREGQRVIVNYMSANRSTVRQALGITSGG